MHLAKLENLFFDKGISLLISPAASNDWRAPGVLAVHSDGNWSSRYSMKRVYEYKGQEFEVTRTSPDSVIVSRVCDRHDHPDLIIGKF